MKIKINWYFIVTELLEIIFMASGFAFIMMFGVAMGVRFDGRSSDVEGLLALAFVYSLVLTPFVRVAHWSLRPLKTDENYMTIRGLKVLLEKYSDQQPTNILSIVEDPAGLEKKRKSKRPVYLQDYSSHS